MCQEMFSFIILATAISGMPTPEICFLQGQFRLTILPKEHHGESVNWTHNLPIERRTLYHISLSPPQRNLCRQFLGVRRCYDGELGSYCETKDTRKRIKLALVIYRDFMQKNLSDFGRKGNINQKQLEP